MTTYAIGDLQGCYQQLQQLLGKLNFDPASDRLWFAGDLVNRGPDSLATLRLVYQLRDSATVVLGNHDLHMLAAFYDSDLGNRKDTFNEAFGAPDGAEILAWLQHQPLLHEQGNYLLCHAGINPAWTVTEAKELAIEVETVLKSSQAGEFFRTMYGNEPAKWSDNLLGYERLRFITNSFTRMRYCREDGSLDLSYKGPLDEAPSGLIPWFNFETPDPEHWQGKILLIGHWASLQVREPRTQLHCLDTGCVWGNSLSAFALETGEWFSVPGWQAH